MASKSVGCPVPQSSPTAMDENKLSLVQSVLPAEKRVVIRSTGECPEPFSETAFIGNGMCRGIWYTCIGHQSMSQGCSHTKTGIIYR